MADLLPDPDTILSTMIAPTLDVLGDRVVRCEGEERLNYWSAFKVSTMHDARYTMHSASACYKSVTQVDQQNKTNE